MPRTVSVIVPVKDGARFLEELIAAVHAQAADAADLELLVIDSGSSDGSPAIARAAGADVLEIPAHEFGHGRTRNLGAERTSGELICFLTQDATPLPGWLAAFQEAFDLDPRVGAAYGPHRSRPDTSPMIARELEEFFDTHAPDGRPALQGPGGEAFLSNANAAYQRGCWKELRLPDVRYSEDQAFAQAMLAAGWLKVYHPAAAVLHAHDYSPAAFARRYFDEYRGLRETIGHVEGFGARSTARDVRALVAADRRWMRDRGWAPARRARWTARSVLHHGSRKTASALGSRAHALPAPVQRQLSLERTAHGADPGPPAAQRPGPPRGVSQPARAGSMWREILEVARDGVAPLLPSVPQAPDRPLHLAVVIPPFRRGSGGHNSIFQLLSRLERKGHTVSVWLHDPIGVQGNEWPAVVARNIREWFAPLQGPVYKGFDHWYGADVGVATSWQTVHPLLRLEGCRARAYLVHDHESEFYATSAESKWAEQTYAQGLHAIAASRWLADIIERRYGGTASVFDFGVDGDVYRPRPIRRRRDTVLFYAREVTPRRAVPLGLLALEELKRRRPDVRVVMFGEIEPIDAPFEYEHLGIASPEQLAWAYSEATVGLCLSLTNYSLIPQEMLACGLPCVDVAGLSPETVFGADGPVDLVPLDPVELADALERLLSDDAHWEQRSHVGRDFVAERTWDRAADQVEGGLRRALAERQQAPHPQDTIGLGATPPMGTDWSARTLSAAQPDTRPATRRLVARLAREEVAQVETALDDEQRQFWTAASDELREHLTLCYGVWHRVPSVLDKTGLLTAEPPEGIHAMSRGPLAAGGDFYSADLVGEAVERTGGSMETVRRGLDFGCSSGRTARAVMAAWPDTEWHGTDPNGPAVAWAARHLPGIAFRVAPMSPPLPFPPDYFDLVYAISVWSHFAEAAALRWLDEMRRIVAPGGRLVLTLHGLQSVAYYGMAGLRPPRQLEQIRRALYRSGFWFAPEFGEEGDFGVKHPEWGTSFIAPEWLLRQATPAWEVVDYRIGRNAGNEDVAVLRLPVDPV
jgi:O-antigen biosynthesis protein